MLITGTSLVHSLAGVSEPASRIEGAAKKSSLQVMDGIHHAWMQELELVIYAVNCSMHSRSDGQSHSRLHKTTGSQPASELSSCFLSGSVFHPLLSLKHSRFLACNSNDVRPCGDTCIPDCKCLCCILTLLLNRQHFDFIHAFYPT